MKHYFSNMTKVARYIDRAHAEKAIMKDLKDEERVLRIVKGYVIRDIIQPFELEPYHHVGICKYDESEKYKLLAKRKDGEYTIIKEYVW